MRDRSPWLWAGGLRACIADGLVGDPRAAAPVRDPCASLGVWSQDSLYTSGLAEDPKELLCVQGIAPRCIRNDN